MLLTSGSYSSISTKQIESSPAAKGQSEDLSVRRLGFESHLCPLLAVWLWLWFSHLLNEVNNPYFSKLP